MFAPIVKNLVSYPLKSGRPLSVSAAFVKRDGFNDDRRMMAVDEAGVFITARETPEMLSIAVSYRGGRVFFSAPGVETIELASADICEARLCPAEIWGQPIEGNDGGDRIASWLSAVLSRSARLLIQSPRAPRPFNAVPDCRVNFGDSAPVLLTNEASLEELNRHLGDPADMLQFRPNIVLSKAEAFAEDGWKHLRIGDLEFEVVDDCARCVFTTMDPVSGERNLSGEPMTTLARLRRARDRKDSDVYFGVYLRPCTQGHITIGDRVEFIGQRPRRNYTVPAPEGAEPIKPEPIVQRNRAFECVGVVSETSDIKTFELRPKDGKPMRYHAGQFVLCHLPMTNGSETRSFTLSSSPVRGSMIQITAKRHRPDGGVAWMHKALKQGQELEISGPFGHLHLAGIPRSDKLAFFAAGSGVTPFLSILRSLADLGERRDIYFHYSVNSVEDFFCAAEVEELARRSGGALQVKCHVGSSAGRLTTADISHLCSDFSERQIYCCGPEGFMSLIRGSFPDHVASARYHEESFGGSQSIDSDQDVEPYKLTFLRSGHYLSGDTPRTILSLAREIGVMLPSSCEVGVCGKCRCKIAGEWRLSSHCADPERSALNADEKQNGIVLACCTIPSGDVEIDF